MTTKQIKDLTLRTALVDTDQFPLDDASNATWKTTLADIRKKLFASPAQGTIIYYNGSDWVILSPGTAGFVLETEGAGANPAWASPKAIKLYDSALAAISWSTGAAPGVLVGINGTEIYPNNDAYGLYGRLVTVRRTPVEGWRQNADEAVWTGWASYTGFVTPSTISRSGSCLTVMHSSNPVRAFYYRPFLNGSTLISTRCFSGAGSAVGIMVDDGVGNADGLGANNFLRIFSERAGDTGLLNISEEHRAGGGAVTKNVLYTGISPTTSYAFNMNYGIGTRWTNWANNFGLNSDLLDSFISQIAGLTWTPARHGLYFYTNSPSRQSAWDWFAEN